MLHKYLLTSRPPSGIQSLFQTSQSNTWDASLTFLITSQVGPSKLGEEVEEGVFEVGEEVFKVGEGLFAAIDLPKATTVCLYSGLTMTKVGEQSMSRYS